MTLASEIQTPSDSGTERSEIIPEPRAPVAHNAARSVTRNQFLVGALCGIAAAIIYTSANVCLRLVNDLDSFLVSTVRAVPTLALVLPMLAVRAFRNQPLVIRGNHVWLLAVCGIAGQLFGNVCFQHSLKIVGIAIAVPLILGTMILSGAIISWIVLGERLKWFTTAGMAVVLVALVCVAFGARTAQASAGLAESSLQAVSNWELALAILGNCAGGVAYAVMGVVMRRSFKAGMPVETAILVVSLVGMVLLGGLTATRMSVEEVLQIGSRGWQLMLLAGLFNGLAFFALSIALRYLNVLFVHMINASQASLAFLAGVIYFHEPNSAFIQFGLLLTVVGLLIAGFPASRRNKRTMPNPSADGTAPTSSLDDSNAIENAKTESD